MAATRQGSKRPASRPKTRPDVSNNSAARSKGKSTGKRRFIDYPRSRRTGFKRWLPSFKQLLALASLGVAVIVAGVVYLWTSTPIPDPNTDAQAATSTVLFADGTTPIGNFSSYDRTPVTLEQNSDYMEHAVVASEDKSFYENSGIDPIGLARALKNNLQGGPLQGGSTLTQQYVERYYVGETTTSIRGKLEEMVLAVKIDQTQSKDEILNNYLNTIYFGRGAYGIEQAAQVYFGHSAAELTPSEAAMIAGIIPAPSSWDPAKNPEKAQQRWQRTIDLMLEEGYITAEEHAAAAFPSVLPVTPSDQYGGTNGYLLDMARRELLAEGFTEEQLDGGGPQITTTIDPRLQQAAYDAVHKITDGKPEGQKVALVSENPDTGGILAIYAGDDYLTQPRNQATQDSVQAGSTFKPFTLIAHLEQGGSLSDTYSANSPMDVEGFGTVKNYGGASYGPMNLVRATANSVNTVYAQLSAEVTPEASLDVAVRAGIPEDTTGLEAVPSIVLGPASPHVSDVAAAFSTYAAQGIARDQHIVAWVINGDAATAYVGPGETAPDGTASSDQGERVFSEDVMADTTYALSQVVKNGSASVVKALDRPVAGKTGTSQENRSAWFAGYIPQMTTVVGMYQVGPDGSEQTLTPWGGYSSIYGGSFPSKVWLEYMQTATEGMEIEKFPNPTEKPSAVAPSATPTPTPTPTPEAPVEPAPEPTVPVEPEPSLPPTPTPTPSATP